MILQVQPGKLCSKKLLRVGSKLKILIVDDNIIRRKKLISEFSKITEKSFIEIKHCDTSDKARKLCKNIKFDLLILDVCLPKKDGFKSTQKEGLNFLRSIQTTDKYFTPIKVIGITANIQDIAIFREEFMEYTYIVYEAPINSNKWIYQVIENTKKVISSNIKEELNNEDKLLISVHGIRTFGQWQNTLTNIIKENSNSIIHYSYQYNFFDLASFFFPFTRKQKADELIIKINQSINSNPDKKIYLVGHSFGTYVISRLIEKNTFKNKIELVILSGSVLPTSYEIENKISPKVNKIINDCGVKDFVLIINKIFVYGLGDSGRKGFVGVNNSKMINRYFNGGHSLYFESNENSINFMEENWIPYILQNKDLQVIDQRTKSSWYLDIIEPAITILSYSFPFILIYSIYMIFK